MKSLVVLSGGQDSTTCLYWSIRTYGLDRTAAITFDYGQRHRREIEAAITVGMMSGISSHEVVQLGDDILRSTSPLTNPNAELETYENYQQMDQIIGTRVEKTFVPMRNALFLTIAANRALALGCDIIITGVCEQDNANYPDCRAQFIMAQEQAINRALGNSDYIKIVTPLMFKSKAESIRMAMELPGCMDALAYSHTAYDGSYPPISKDHANTLRAQGFVEAGVPDPLIVRAWQEGLMSLPDSPNYDVFREPPGPGPIQPPIA